MTSSTGKHAADPVHRVRAVALAVREARHRELSETARQRFLFAALVGLASVRLVHMYLGSVSAALLAVRFGAQEVTNLTRFWVANPTGVVRP